MGTVLEVIRSHENLMILISSIRIRAAQVRNV